MIQKDRCRHNKTTEWIDEYYTEGLRPTGNEVRFCQECNKIVEKRKIGRRRYLAVSE